MSKQKINLQFMTIILRTVQLQITRMTHHSPNSGTFHTMVLLVSCATFHPAEEPECVSAKPRFLYFICDFRQSVSKISLIVASTQHKIFHAFSLIHEKATLNPQIVSNPGTYFPYSSILAPQGNFIPRFTRLAESSHHVNPHSEIEQRSPDTGSRIWYLPE